MNQKEPNEILRDARELKGYTQTVMAELMAAELNQTYSMRQYQRLEEGLFPKFKKEIIIAADKILGTKVYDMIYEQNVPHGNKKKGSSDATAVEFDGFMEVEYVPTYAQAGYLNNIEHSALQESLPTILVPKEFEKGKYLVIEVNGDSMDDGTKRSICEGDKLLIKDLDKSLWKNKLIYNRYIFVIVHPEGMVVKEIIHHEPGNGKIVCHSWNPIYEDFTLNLTDVYQLFYVKKIVERKPVF